MTCPAGIDHGATWCPHCAREAAIAASAGAAIEKRRKAASAARRRAAERDAIRRSLGLVKVRGSAGGTFWE